MKYYKFILYTVCATVIIDIFRYLSWVETVNIPFSTYITLFLSYSSLFFIAYIVKKTSHYYEQPNTIKYLFGLWLLWNVFNIVRGAIIGDGYWDWKFLFITSGPFSLISIFFYIGSNLFFSKKVLRFYSKYIFTLGFLLIPLALATNQQLYARIMIPVSIFLLLLPYVKYRWKVLTLTVTVVSVITAIGLRAHILKVIISILVLSLFYFRKVIRHSWVKIAHFALFIVPIVLLILGLTGYLNVFEQVSRNYEYNVATEKGEQQDLTSDTRTFVYAEVLTSMGKTSNWIFGKSASGSYKSQWFYNTGGARKGIRHRSEVNILNILLYYGIVGVVLYLLLLYYASHLAIYYSNNILSKMLGLVIASRWALSFVEEYTQYDLNFLFFWLIMGLVSSTLFRNMSDNEIKSYLRT